MNTRRKKRMTQKQSLEAVDAEVERFIYGLNALVALLLTVLCVVLMWMGTPFLPVVGYGSSALVFGAAFMHAMGKLREKK
jgi:hypothetical protein